MTIVKRVLILCLLLVCGVCVAAGQEFYSADLVLTREWIREEFRQAKEKDQLTTRVVSYLEGQRQFPSAAEDSPILLSYYGALKGLQARHAFSPAKKFHYLSLCLDLLDRAVAADGDDLEVRFVRFATLHHLPPVLGVGARRGQDIEWICRSLGMKDYSIVDEPTQREMTAFMLESRRISPQQRQLLMSLYP